MQGDGVYRLSDGVKLFTTSGSDFTFSADGTYVAVSGDGVYRLSDGVRLVSGSYFTFSADGAYVAVREDGVYRLSDNKHISGARLNDTGWVSAQYVDTQGGNISLLPVLDY